MSAVATALVGREPELAAPSAANATACSGTTGVVVLSGEPGIGKTARLTSALDRQPRSASAATRRSTAAPTAEGADVAVHVELGVT